MNVGPQNAKPFQCMRSIHAFFLNHYFIPSDTVINTLLKSVKLLISLGIQCIYSGVNYSKYNNDMICAWLRK